LPSKLCYDDVNDIPWFQEVVLKSEAYLATVPDDFLGSWYKQYRDNMDNL
jgi:hypothetical protein